MKGVHVVGAGQGIWGTSLPEAEANCQISVQVLTFSCTIFRIYWV